MLLTQILAEAGVALAGAIPVLVGLGAAIGMGMAVGKGVEAMARQPEAASKIQGLVIMGLAFIETTAIYGLFISIVILFL